MAESSDTAGTEDEKEYPVYRPEDYQSRNYPLPGTIKVWDPELQRSIDSKKSPVPDDCLVIEVETMFVEREYLIPVINIRTGLVDQRLTASHVSLGGAYPGVTVVFPLENGHYVEYRRPFTEDKEEYRIRDGPAPDPFDSDTKVIWVHDPEDQEALADSIE